KAACCASKKGRGSTKAAVGATISSNFGPSTPSTMTATRLPLGATVAKRTPRELTTYGLRLLYLSATGPTTCSSTFTAAETPALSGLSATNTATPLINNDHGAGFMLPSFRTGTNL